MPHSTQIEVALLPAEARDERALLEKTAAALRVLPEDIKGLLVDKRSVDARGSRPVVRLRVAVSLEAPFAPEPALLKDLRPVDGVRKAIVIGTGPAGYFAALELISLGIKPILFDRGKDVRTRRRDLRAIQQFGTVPPDSNYCFGEGGAGTYSDGKLYTRSHKRGELDKAMRLFVEHGANPDILVDAHPHIGSNKLPQIVANIRETILYYGGEIHFDSTVTDLILHQGYVKGVQVNAREEYFAEAVVLATGHSARDVYTLLHRLGIRLEAKPFALGVRAEHPQGLIDAIQYRQSPRERDLPAASYKLVAQVEGRGVFSFCMCPGGLVVPAATAPGEIVVNGMSMSRRDSPYANSGIVVAIEAEDLAPYAQFGVFAGLAFQKEVEQRMFQAGDGSQKAPAQRLTDFVAGKVSADLPKCSYIPGLFEAPLHQLLPASVYKRLQRGLRDFDKKMPGYLTGEAVAIGTESRTSAPVRIPRHPVTLMHPEVQGLFPAGEGAGFAGGILSAAMDGQNVARAVSAFFNVHHTAT